MRDGQTFLVDEMGRVAGEPFVLPHAPGERACGLVPGWYRVDADEPDGVDGPYNSEWIAKQ